MKVSNPWVWTKNPEMKKFYKVHLKILMKIEWRKEMNVIITTCDLQSHVKSLISSIHTTISPQTSLHTYFGPINSV